MSTHRLIVYTQPAEGQEDAYNKWYDEVHLREVLQIEGFVAAQRFALSEAQIGETEGARRYMAIYEIEAESLEDALAKLNGGADSMNMSDALDLESAHAIAYSAIGEKLFAL